MSVKTSEVTNFLRFAVGLSMGHYSVDENDFILKKDGNKVMRGDPARPIILYKEQIKDSEPHLLNPFSEGVTESDAGKWFYRTMNGSMEARIYEVMNVVIKRAVDEHTHLNMSAAEKKKRKIKPLVTYPSVLTNLVSTIVKKVDAKMISELKTLMDYTSKPSTVNGLIYLLYSRKHLRTRLELPIVEEGDDYEAPSGIRKGTIPVFRTLLMAIFDLKDADDISKYTAKADEDATPKIDSYMRCMFRVYSQINEMVDAIDGEWVVDLSEFKGHLDKMGAYSQNARSMASSSPVPSKSTLPVMSAPAATQAPIPFPSNIPSSPTPARSVIPGPLRADGSSGPPIDVSAPSYGYTGPTMPVMNQPMMNSGLSYANVSHQPMMGNMPGGHNAPPGVMIEQPRPMNTWAQNAPFVPPAPYHR